MIKAPTSKASQQSPVCPHVVDRGKNKYKGTLRHLILKSPSVCHSFFPSFIPLKFSSTMLHNSVRHASAYRNASTLKKSNRGAA